MNKITAKQAINRECRDCCGTINYRKVCCSPNCALSPAREFKSSVRRIKAHCIECNPAKTIIGIKDCGGELCHLYPFREGKNPFRAKKEYSEAERHAMVARLAPARVQNKTPNQKTRAGRYQDKGAISR